MDWRELKNKKEIKLYAGDLSKVAFERGFVGLSLTTSNKNHIQHDVTKQMLIDDNSVDVYQSEDVYEHIEYDKLLPVINEVYRVLKPNGLFRLSVPDYRCNMLYDRCLATDEGKILFDPGGGGTFENPGHVWFPQFESVRDLLKKSKFTKINYLHYYKSDVEYVMKSVDYSVCFVQRVPEHDFRVQHPMRPMSIVVDCVK